MIKELLLDENIGWYTGKYELAEYKTVYHTPGFLYAEEAGEEESTYLYCYEKGGEYVIFPSIKRRINDLQWFMNEDIPECFDIITPHEYSGVVASNADDGMIRSFYRELGEFCGANNIIYSFVRFNPYRYEQELAEGYSIKLSGQQTWIDLRDSDFVKDYKGSSCRGVIRRAERDGVVIKEVEKSKENINAFITMYEKAMRRLEAKKFFYFNRDYFLRMSNLPYVKYYFAYNDVGMCGASIVLVDDVAKRGYYHLACRDSDIRAVGVMESLIDYFSHDLRDEGYCFIHLGGGATESLRSFKEKFSNERVDYYIGKSIFDSELYELICNKYIARYPQERFSEFIPLYRSLE